ncbi:hypothetical protein [Nitrosomonas sp. JL21]|nr:hypothetical protein [Nitrosomonas sp. JL21]
MANSIGARRLLSVVQMVHFVNSWILAVGIAGGVFSNIEVVHVF